MSFTTQSFVGIGQQIEFNGAYILAHTMDITYSGSKVDIADTTDTSSTGGTRTFISALNESGECTVKCIWYPGEVTQGAMDALTGTTATFVHTLPNSLGTRSFSGLLVSSDRTAPLDKAGEITYKIKISGVITYAHS